MRLDAQNFASFCQKRLCYRVHQTLLFLLDNANICCKTNHQTFLFNVILRALLLLVSEIKIFSSEPRKLNLSSPPLAYLSSMPCAGAIFVRPLTCTIFFDIIL
jgi:hypothetical protein